METLSENERESNENSEEEEISEESKGTRWKIDYDKEKTFWEETILTDFIYLPKIWPKWGHNTMRMLEKKSNSLINPYYLKFLRYKCQKRENIRNYSFLKITKNISASIIYEIIIQFILEKKNGKEIEKL